MSVEQPRFTLKIQGRIDGIWPMDTGVVLEEIKTVDYAWDEVAEPLHWAQAKLYGWLYIREGDSASLEIQLTYFDLIQQTVTVFRETFSRETLELFFSQTLDVYLGWLTRY